MRRIERAEADVASLAAFVEPSAVGRAGDLYPRGDAASARFAEWRRHGDRAGNHWGT